jgi:hypothetical protein
MVMVMTMLVLADERNPGRVIVRRAHAGSRVRAHVCAHRLDRALAAGIPPDSRADLSVRAHGLIGSRERLALARAIRRVIEDSEHARRPMRFAVPICRRKVRRSQQTLVDILERLLGHEPLDARGVAQIRLLLSDGAGPLYVHPQVDDLEPALARAVAALDVQTQAS